MVAIRVQPNISVQVKPPQENRVGLRTQPRSGGRLLGATGAAAGSRAGIRAGSRAAAQGPADTFAQPLLGIKVGVEVCPPRVGVQSARRPRTRVRLRREAHAGPARVGRVEVKRPLRGDERRAISREAQVGLGTRETRVGLPGAAHPPDPLLTGRNDRSESSLEGLLGAWTLILKQSIACLDAARKVR